MILMVGLNMFNSFAMETTSELYKINLSFIAENFKQSNQNSNKNNIQKTEVEFICEECKTKGIEKKFANQRLLEDHKYNVHSDQPTICDICKKVFKNKRRVIGHKSYKHRGRRFPC